MSFGDLLVLVLFVLFVVLPAINRSQQRRRGGLPPGPPARGPQPGTGAGAPAAGRQASDAESGPMTFPPLEEDDLARRLAEARERVRQAMAQQSDATTAAQRPTASAAEADPRARARAPLVSGPPPGTVMGDQGATAAAQVDPRLRARGLLVSGPPPGTVKGDRPRGPTPLVRDREVGTARTLPARDLRSEAPRIEVERLAERTGVAGLPGLRLAFDVASVREGLVWHQVLSAPRSRRRLGGGPFPER